MNRRFLTLLIGVVLLIVAIYRAVTQSITIDEAQTYNEYVRQGWHEIFQGWFDANNHVLYSALERISVDLFGVSELSLRVPALLGAALLLWSLSRICTRLVADARFCVLTYLMVACNPVTLDFMVAARGYGLGLGLFAYALSELVEWFDDGRDWRIPLASGFFGLAIGANLIFVFATAGASAAASIWIALRWRFLLLIQLILPCVGIALALWWLPFQNYASDRFYLGEERFMGSLETMGWVLFLHNPDRGDPFGNWITLYYFRQWIVPFLAAGLAVSATFVRRPIRFLILALFGTCAALWIAHHSYLHIKYPTERTGLALIFLFFLCWMITAADLWPTLPGRWLFAGPSLCLALILLAQFAGQFDARYFGSWRGDSKMNQLMAALKGKHGSLHTHWVNRPAAVFYRERYGLDLPEIPYIGGDKLELKGADFYIVPSITDDEIEAAHLRILYRDSASGTTLLGPEL